MPTTEPAAPTEAPLHPASRGGTWPWSILYGAVAGMVLVGALHFGRMFATGNFHTVLPGRVYRCAQPTPARLERMVRAHGIRTVVNLRGCCANHAWYLDECRTTRRLGISQEDICLSAGRLPSVYEVRRLVEVLDRSEYPILLHCHRGADRTGLAAVMVLLLYTDLDLARASRQLGWRYGHVALGRPANLAYFFNLYEAWLQEHGWVHSPARFRRWATREYCPGACWCRVELLEIPARVPCGEPFAVRARFHNTSRKTWHLHPENSAGVHAMYTLCDRHYRALAIGRAGLFKAVVSPGQSIELTVALPPVLEPGRYLLRLDMVDEQQCCFFQTGSEPLEQELVIGEEEAAARGQRGPAGLAGLANRLAPGR